MARVFVNFVKGFVRADSVYERVCVVEFVGPTALPDINDNAVHCLHQFGRASQRAKEVLDVLNLCIVGENSGDAKREYEHSRAFVDGDGGESTGNVASCTGQFRDARIGPGNDTVKHEKARLRANELALRGLSNCGCEV